MQVLTWLLGVVPYIGVRTLGAATKQDSLSLGEPSRPPALL